MCGSLSKPSKMPCFGYGLSAMDCNVGSALRNVPGSVCEKCYAMRGNYLFPNVRAAHLERLKAIQTNIVKWEKDITALIRGVTRDNPFFRWHDSGDIQSARHMQAIINVAHNLPDVMFWLPTKEYTIARKFEAVLPRNLIMRVSFPQVGEAFPTGEPYQLTSSVDSGVGFKCGAYERQGKCGDCRACWDNSIPNIDYPQH